MFLVSKFYDGAPVSSGQDLRTIGFSVLTEILLHVGRPDAVLTNKAIAVSPNGIGTDFRLVVLSNRRDQIQVKGGCIGAVLVEDDSCQCFLADTYLPETEATILACPYDKIALAASQRRLTLDIALLGHNRIQLGIVI